MAKTIRPASVILGEHHAIMRSGWLSEQPVDFQHRVAELGRWRRYRLGEVVYAVGDTPDAVYGLEDGMIDISLPISDDEMVNIWRGRPGMWFGDSAVISDVTRKITVTAHADCLFLVLPTAAVRRHLQRHPHDYLYFYRMSLTNTMTALNVLADVIALPPRARFARLLLRISTESGVVHATQHELGALTGMSRVAFRRALSELIECGVLKTEYRAVRILDREALAREAESR